MAIDTEEKRRSALNFGRRGATLPVAVGTIGAGERKHLLGGYSGVTAPPPPTVSAWYYQHYILGRRSGEM